ncbi:hypothetical protein SAMN05421788_103281 [Filimonas lacunae]|uniref:Uncharacterized protein n=1 Tax=Filimonas lacunae TaxID=477680 RepID=A0A173MJX0_9BACT|nr:hypothetical protein [Filimonas lacunae]BAV07935.1 hypothetical protein FLA_3967 [Filimonas lacunae]SIT06845.1 hypothetical protein SAMN05421788_103281 [Filimonas lacunae]
MFSFLQSLFSKKAKADISFFIVPDPGWEKITNDATARRWRNEEHTKALSLHFFQLSPDLPSIKDVNLLRKYYRRLMIGMNTGIIEVEVVRQRSLPYVKTIVKSKQEGGGILYVGALTFPFKNCSYVVKVEAIETGATGMRETIIADRLMKEGKSAADDWASDPYDSSFTEGVLMNKAEDAVYDAAFPAHSLTVVREMLALLEKEVSWKPEAEGLPAFSK